MKTFKLVMAVMALATVIIYSSCSHCDDEDLTRKEKEQEEGQRISGDSMSVS